MKLCFRGHVLTENRNGLVVEASLTQADAYAEREAAVAMLEAIPGRRRPRWGRTEATTLQDSSLESAGSG